jgi:rubrerythrin
MFSLKDIINIAVQIEQNGERVYIKAAEKTEDPSLRDLLQWLADEEIKHVEWFEALKATVSSTGNYPEQEKMGRKLLKDAVGAQSFALENADFSNMEKVEDLLELAIEFEKDTVLFYKMLQPFMEDRETLNQLHAVIQEEEKHAQRLKAFLENKKIR